jgi:hypothetical protein
MPFAIAGMPLLTAASQRWFHVGEQVLLAAQRVEAVPWVGHPAAAFGRGNVVHHTLAN